MFAATVFANLKTDKGSPQNVTSLVECEIHAICHCDFSVKTDTDKLVETSLLYPIWRETQLRSFAQLPQPGSPFGVGEYAVPPSILNRTGWVSSCDWM